MAKTLDTNRKVTVTRRKAKTKADLLVTETLPSTPAELLQRYQNNWVKFATEVIGVYLDSDQAAILESVRVNRRTTVSSGHARGKDFITAVCSLCFLFLKYPSKVVETAPTGRQVYSIMMSELQTLYNKANARLAKAGLSMGGDVLKTRIQMPDPNWFLEGFKAGDKATEAWTGYHGPNVLVAVTEASGIPQETFDAIEGLLTGNSRLLIVGNPNRLTGEFYTSFRSKLYHKFSLNCLNAPNVVNKKTLIPGQVDYEWVKEHLQKAGWVTRITEEELNPEFDDFEFDGDFYRPSDLCRVKILGKFPRQSETTLIPLSWIDAANQRWEEQRTSYNKEMPLLLGVDVAGMGNDNTYFCFRRGQYVEKFKGMAKKDNMQVAGNVMTTLKAGDTGYIDTIGEGAGVYSRLQELGASSTSVKFSESADGLRDLTGEREFANMRAYCYWALRDALDPNLDGQLALPPDEELTQELTETGWALRSTGKIIIEPKEDIKKRITRSPDKADSLALTFYPRTRRQVAVAGGYDVNPW